MKTNTDFIKELAQKMKAQDNRATQYPLYYVYEKEERWVDGDDSWDFKLWLDEDYNEVERMSGNEWDDEVSERYDDEWGNTAFVREVDVPVVDVGPFSPRKLHSSISTRMATTIPNLLCMLTLHGETMRCSKS